MMNDSQRDRSQQILTRRRFLQTALTASAGAVLAACGSASTAAPTVGADGRANITLSMWTHDSLYATFFGARGEEWKETYPQYNISFNFQAVPEPETKILANLAAQLPIPDLIGIEQGTFPRYMRDDVIEAKFVDLTPLIGDERDQFVQGSWSKFTHKGKIYGVDSGLCATVLYYQPAVLEKAGVDVPTTWEESVEVGEKLAAQGSAFMSFGGESYENFMLLFFQRGGRFFDEASNFVFNSPENRQYAIEVLNYIKTGIDRRFIKLFSSADFWGPAIYASYKDGSSNGIVMPDWYSDAQIKASIPDMAGQWRIAPQPRWAGGGLSTSSWGGTGFAVYSESPNVELAWDLLHYTYMTKENQIKRYEELKYYPTMLEALSDPRVSGAADPYYADQLVGEVFASIAPEVPVWYQSPIRGVFETALNAQLNAFYSGQITAEQMMDMTVAQTEEAIRFL
jgi:ABC-type glycerol-3-phosphate transport system substrate-binding protein